MSEYLISILGIVVLGVVVDLVMPSGQMSKYIKGTFGIFTVLVIVSPLPKLLKLDFDFSSLFYNQASIEIDKDFLEATNNRIVEQLCFNVEKSCENAGFLEIKCEIKSNLEDNKLVIKKVIIDLKNMVINQNKVHINKYDEIIDAVRQVVNIDKEKIEFYE